MNTHIPIACVIGTRPEAIKMVPVVRALQASNWARCLVVATAQHRDLLDQMLQQFGVRVDYDLDLMQPGQTPSDFLARMLPALTEVCLATTPAAILAQGDTATVLGTALTAFHQGIPFGHVEAGLRTGNLAHPFPEEGYRQMVARITRWHFAPTDAAAAALHAEGIARATVHVTGNTCIDTLLQTVGTLAPVPDSRERLILLTAHRRENFGEPIQSIFQGVLRVVERFPDTRLVYPVHPNPNVQTPAHAILGNHPRISLIPPQDYFAFVDLMRRATLILTDSGGIQEEAPALSKPVLVLRETTERPEAVSAGVSRLVGTQARAIESAVSELLQQPLVYQAMCGSGVSPFGDGRAALRIKDILESSLQV